MHEVSSETLFSHLQNKHSFQDNHTNVDSCEASNNDDASSRNHANSEQEGASRGKSVAGSDDSQRDTSVDKSIRAEIEAYKNTKLVAVIANLYANRSTHNGFWGMQFERDVESFHREYESNLQKQRAHVRFSETGIPDWGKDLEVESKYMILVLLVQFNMEFERFLGSEEEQILQKWKSMDSQSLPKNSPELFLLVTRKYFRITIASFCLVCSSISDEDVAFLLLSYLHFSVGHMNRLLRVQGNVLRQRRNRMKDRFPKKMYDYFFGNCNRTHEK